MNFTEKELMGRGFTKHGANNILKYKKDYPLLYRYYDAFSGNFIIPHDEFSDDILKEALVFLQVANKARRENHKMTSYCLSHYEDESADPSIFYCIALYEEA